MIESKMNLEELDYFRSYQLQVKKNEIIDASQYVSGLLRFINHSNTNSLKNCKFVKIDNDIQVVVIKKISKGISDG